jgi:hypothetical protein
MRKILFLALAAPLFVACETGGGAAVSPNNANMGNPDRALRAAQPGSGQNAAGSGTATVTGASGDASTPVIQRGEAAPGTGVGCPPGTRLVTVNSTRGDSRPQTECR